MPPTLVPGLLSPLNVDLFSKTANNLSLRITSRQFSFAAVSIYLAQLFGRLLVFSSASLVTLAPSEAVGPSCTPATTGPTAPAEDSGLYYPFEAKKSSMVPVHSSRPSPRFIPASPCQNSFERRLPATSSHRAENSVTCLSSSAAAASSGELCQKPQSDWYTLYS